MEFPKHIVEGVINLTIQQFKEAEQHIDKMNNLPSVEGFFYKNYSQSAGRLYFTDENAKKIDACRQNISTIQNQTVRSCLLGCLLEALSKVSNTTGVQGSFLKNFKDRAVHPLTVKAKRAYFTNNVKAYSRDVVELMKSPDYRGQYQENILYIDPPYNERQYGSNYHLYETLVRYDDPIIIGKGGVRNWQAESKSLF
jgi:adenine-specific DNA-methyltransferase